MSDNKECFQQQQESGAISARERLTEVERNDPSLTPLICKILQLSHDKLLAESASNS